MAPDHTSILAGAVLNEGNSISYRLLARELKVHGNLAKRMLFDFHQKQNQKKKSSVHATYLIDGLVREETSTVKKESGEDVPMQSSPFMSSSAPQGTQELEPLYRHCVTLAKEEDLEVVKAQYSQISSIHIYSLQSSTVKNLQILSECNRTVGSKFYNEDPLAVGKQYGVIHNANVKRRTARKPPPGVAPAIAPKTSGGSKTQPASKPTAKVAASLASQATAQDTSTKNDSTGKTETKPGVSRAPVKREQSDIFKQFTKPKAQIKRADTTTSTESKAAETSSEKKKGDEDVFMRDASEDEDDNDKEDDAFVSENKADPETSKKRKDRADDLRKMMDDEDDEVPDAPTPASIDEEIKTPDLAPDAKEPAPPAPEVVGGRRRGKRKVMKKKTMKDEDGYLVTREEAVWESFSEDEAPAPQASSRGSGAQTQTHSQAKKKGAPAGGGGGGGGAKAGQGNIMSFFGKK